MKLRFPFGRAPLALVVCAIVSGVIIAVADVRQKRGRPDLTLVTASPSHVVAYQKLVPAFEAKHGVNVEVQLVNWQALKGRLRNALLANREVGDLVELQANALGVFTSGPPDEMGFLDLGDRLRSEGLDKRLVPSRLALWSVADRTIAVPHDVHPVVFVYRRDLVESLGIDVSTLRTWDDFATMGRKVTADLDGDGVTDRYAVDFGAPPTDLRRLLTQRDADVVGPDGAPRLGGADQIDTIAWYVRQTIGAGRIATAAGWGQSYSKAILEGLVLFYPVADWRTKMIQEDVAGAAGKLAVMPLPAWKPGGRRTAGEAAGTGMAIPTTSKRVDLAWQLLRYLYLDESQVGARFADSNILPPLPAAWSAAELSAPNAFYSGQSLGKLLVELAPEVPDAHTSPFEPLLEAKLDEVYRRSSAAFEANPNVDLRAVVTSELARAADAVGVATARNRLMAGGKP